jgi:hypothetical protein
MAAYDPDKVTLFARTNARGQDVAFGIKAKDRQRHMYVIGKTGMGKSTLLENMAAQDIRSGEGMAFIDPHGSAIETLLEYVPEERLDDVVYFAPFDMENPISFNIMEDVGADTRHLVVSGLMSTFKKIWEDAWSARMEYILTNALLALIEYPDTTLLSVNRMLADKAYRDEVVDYVKDPAVKAYWVDEFASYTERFAAEALPAIQNKIGQFTGNPLIRNIIGQPKSSFDVRKMMDEKKILLVNLSKGLVGETNADLLGSMLITKIYLSAMSRAELPPAQMKQMPNFYFYVDEFQSFANSTFANILSEARKYHLNLIIAHQYVAQMEEKIRDAVFGNVGTTVTFRVGPFDAEMLEPVFEPQFLANDLVNLGAFQIYLTLMIDGAGSQPFSAATLPPVPTPPTSHKHMVIKRSQQNYCRPRSEVEQLVTDLHTPKDRVEKLAAGEGGNKGSFNKPSAFHKVGAAPAKKKPRKLEEPITNPTLPKPGGSAANEKSTVPTEEKTREESSSGSGARSTATAPQRMSERTSRTSKQPASQSADELRSILKQVAVSESKKASAKTATATPKQVGTNEHKSALQAALSEVVTPAQTATAASTSTEPDQPALLPNQSKHTQRASVNTAIKQLTSNPHKDILTTLANSLDQQPRTSGEGRQRSQHNSPVNPQTVPTITITKQPSLRVPVRRPAEPLVTDHMTSLHRMNWSAVDTESAQHAEYRNDVVSHPPVSNTKQQSSEKGAAPRHRSSTQTTAEPDIQVIKNMLRQSGREHPPGVPR